MTSLPQLPISELLPSICAELSTHNELLLLAPPGAGKTTLVPLALLPLDALAGQKILVLQPRRIAARATAMRMAELLGEPVGQTVGYRVRMESKVSQHTRIEVITEGLYLRQLQADPTLEGVGLVIFDECHERHLDTDLALALSLNSRALFSDLREAPLKLLMMSATLDGDALQSLLSQACGRTVCQLQSEGRAFPVAMHYLGTTARGQEQTPDLVRAVNKAIHETDGNLLVFLPGVGEIRRLQQALEQTLEEQGFTGTIRLVAIHGSLSLAEQKQALQEPAQGTRQITLATSIAQTSLTIPGITVVIDSGFVREPKFDPRTGLTRLQKVRISKATATQRAGRAGRLGPGTCYRLWSESEQQSLPAQDTPEIINADLAELVLRMRAWGVDDARDLHWLDQPSASAMAVAEALLARIGALAGAGLTGHGEQLAELPVHPRLGHLLLQAKAYGLVDLGSQIAALVSGKDPLMGGDSADINHRLDMIEHSKRGDCQRLRAEAAQLKRQLSDCDVPLVDTPPSQADAVAVLLANAYPDRLAKRRSGHNYKLANGRGVQLAAHDPLAQQVWLVVADLGGMQGQGHDRVFMAASLSPETIEQYFSHWLETRDVLEWSAAEDRFIGERQQWLDKLLLSSEKLSHISPEQKQQAVFEWLNSQGLAQLNWEPQALQWRARVALMAELEPGEWPDVSDSGLLSSLALWFAPALESITKPSDCQRLALLPLLQTLLDWPQQQRLSAQLPEKLQVPSGTQQTLDYCQQPPVLAVRLQEMFGLAETPRLADGRVGLVIHLLSPARRPLQITQDLAGFWAGSYEQVRKEMKGRYPKHHWPDDPYSVPATARAKPRRP